ncbi:SRPBCC family protein [Nocardioides marmorisolisilvae]|uniref:SRPBCC family protein n=1 Tax=Nocardioides marmorisolisilvae TaxID=1542737 RepID=A0A3N0DUH8_9ACTN|nr:SRPBCC family protein [Nocardioides marmorisolisilvae]RNL79294.1 SRPBCC family protein [Nocardioides marmorisolisilvae]
MSTTVTATATVPKPVEHVWAVLSDHEGMSSWGPGLKVTLVEEGTGNRNGLGAVRRIDAPGPAPAIVEEVVVFDENSALGYRAKAGVPFKNYSGLVKLTPAGSGTRVDYSITIDPRVPVVEKGAAAAVARVLLTALVRASKR